MHLSMCCPTTPAPLRLKWGFGREFDTKFLPHYGAFDILVSQIPTVAPYKPDRKGWGYKLIGALA